MKSIKVERVEIFFQGIKKLDGNLTTDKLRSVRGVGADKLMQWKRASKAMIDGL